jgi:hypothetical protein
MEAGAEGPADGATEAEGAAEAAGALDAPGEAVVAGEDDEAGLPGWQAFRAIASATRARRRDMAMTSKRTSVAPSIARPPHYVNNDLNAVIKRSGNNRTLKVPVTGR